MNGANATLYTIGHSTRPLDAFLGLLAESRIECVVDVRRFPGSRKYPQYNADDFAASLAAEGIDYWHLQALCGRRTVSELDGEPAQAFWSNASFARYAAYARGDTFALGLSELRQRAREQRCAVMCSEAVWWRCHRRIISDHLLATGDVVCHIMGLGKVEAASLTRGARVEVGEVMYPER